jgi:mRNA-degrading endonuclease RelE of RelBE toxin-antitoxin system
MSAIEREIIEKLKRLDEVRQKRVLEFVESLESQPPETNLSARTHEAAV